MIFLMHGHVDSHIRPGIVRCSILDFYLRRTESSPDTHYKMPGQGESQLLIELFVSEGRAIRCFHLVPVLLCGPTARSALLQITDWGLIFIMSATIQKVHAIKQ